MPTDCGHDSDKPILCDDCNRLMCKECYDSHKIKQAVDKQGKSVSVELFEAFGWYCLSCGHLNMSKMVRQFLADKPLTETETEELRKYLKLDPWQEVPPLEELSDVLINVPPTVTCVNCRVSFLTDPPPTFEDADDSDDSSDEKPYDIDLDIDDDDEDDL